MFRGIHGQIQGGVESTITFFKHTDKLTLWTSIKVPFIVQTILLSSPLFYFYTQICLITLLFLILTILNAQI